MKEVADVYKRQGLPCAVIVTCLFYGAISGSGPATVAAVGSMTIPILIELGYDKDFSAAIVAVAGGLGAVSYTHLSESVALLCDTSTYRTLYQSGGNAVHYAAKSQPCHQYAGAGA